MASILLVEDDDILAMGVRFALEEERFEVDKAGTLGEAEGLFGSREYDCILLDARLPDGTGFDWCRSVRKRSSVPIVFLTACDEEVNVVQGLDIGADDYVTKPFRVRELISRIRAAMRRSATGPAVGSVTAARLESGGIIAVPLETRVSKHGQTVELTPVEFKLLLLFMRHPQQTLTRVQLLAKLWDEQGEFVDDNTLSVYIRRLREKLEDAPSDPAYIVTVRGVGYKWNQRSGSHA